MHDFFNYVQGMDNNQINWHVAPVRWRKDAHATFYGVTSSESGKVLCWLIVEPLPDSEAWDWAVWDVEMERQGIAPSVSLAIEAARQAAALWISD